MTIYLKYGQSIDLGDVDRITYDDDREVKPAKYCKEGEACFSIQNAFSDIIEMAQFYNKNKVFECKYSDIIGILEDWE